MPEGTVVKNTASGPHTRASLVADLRALGLPPDADVLVHSALSKIGWVVGGEQAVVLALLDALSPDGTLIVPTHSTSNSEPSLWENPPVPEDWWPVIREHMPAYEPATSPTRMMGRILEDVRRWPGAHRSDHPQMSFAAVGARAASLAAGHTPLEDGFGDPSPLGALYEADGYVMLLGVPHENNTSLHLAEVRADYTKQTEQSGAAVMVDGERQWAAWEQLAYDASDFNDAGRAFEAAHPDDVWRGTVGRAPTVLMRQRALVDFAARWFSEHRA